VQRSEQEQIRGRQNKKETTETTGEKVEEQKGTSNVTTES